MSYTGKSCFETMEVKGCNLVPLPPAKTIPLYSVLIIYIYYLRVSLTQLVLSKYQSTVCLRPSSKLYLTSQSSSLEILLASIAYLKSCPGLSSTKLIRSLNEEILFGFTFIVSSKILQISLTTDKFVFSFLPPILYESPTLPFNKTLYKAKYSSTCSQSLI